MNGLELVLGLVIGLGLGGGLLWLALKGRMADLKERQALTEADLAVARQDAALERDRLTEELNQARSRAGAVENEKARLETELAAEIKAATEKQKILLQANEELKNSFAALSAKALEANAKDFLRLAEETFKAHQAKTSGEMAQRHQAVEGVIKPLKESLSQFQQQMSAMERTRQEAYGSLNQQVKALVESENRLRTETGNLVKALRRPQVRGRWGEVQLRRAVEFAGLIEHCDFGEQTTLAGGGARPDMIINLPGGKQIVVDAKTPLDAYLNAIEAEDEAQRKVLMADHVRQIKTQIKNLSDKSYWTELSTTPEMVVMFLPGDAILFPALELDPGLQEEGWNRNVLLATPTLLIALLRTVAYDWRRVAMQENAEEIAKAGRELYDRLGVLARHMTDLGKRLNMGVEYYNKAVGSLERSVLPGARKFTELGIKPKTELIEPAPIEKTTRTIEAPELLENDEED